MSVGDSQTGELPESTLADFATELVASAEDAALSLASRSVDPRRSEGRSLGQDVNLDLIMRIPVTMKVVVGSTTLPVSELKRLKKGATVTLDRKVGDPVDVVVNGRIIARGTLAIVDQDSARLGVSLTQLVDLSGGSSSSSSNGGD